MANKTKTTRRKNKTQKQKEMTLTIFNKQIKIINVNKQKKAYMKRNGRDINENSKNGISLVKFISDKFSNFYGKLKRKDWEKKFTTKKKSRFENEIEKIKFELVNKFPLRNWQREGIEKINKVGDNAHVLIPINASVSSGKTVLAGYAFGKHIADCKMRGIKNSLQLFIVPRVALGKQQFSDIINYMKELWGFEEGNDGDYIMNRRDYENPHFGKKGDTLVGHHIVVMCDETLWGSDKTTKRNRFTDHRGGWYNKFKKYEENGVSLGFVFLDEAHNYDNMQKEKKSEEKSREVEFTKQLRDLFRSVMLASGTPGRFQKESSEIYAEYAINCSVRETIAPENNWALRPRINTVEADYHNNFAAAVKVVFENEIKNISEDKKKYVRILVNCTTIDEIQQILDTKWFKDNCKKLFNIVTIHTDKIVEKNNEYKKYVSTINYKPIKKETLFTKLNEEFDSNAFFSNKELKNLPTFLLQVDTISEGVNLRSFNAVIITTTNEQKAMQQIGRVMRHYKDRKYNKVIYEKDKADVYVLNENRDKIIELLINLFTEYDLNSSCFSWGKVIVIPVGSKKEFEDEEVSSDLVEYPWEDITDENRPNVIPVNIMFEKRIQEMKEEEERNERKQITEKENKIKEAVNNYLISLIEKNDKEGKEEINKVILEMEENDEKIYNWLKENNKI